MRVALVNSFYAPELVGGAEVMVKDLAEGLAASGIASEVFCSGTESVSEKIDGTNVHRVAIAPTLRLGSADKNSNAATRLLAHARRLHMPKIAQEVATRIRESQPDVIHVHNVRAFSPALYSAIDSECPGVPLIQTLHDYWIACIRSTLLNSRKQICEVRPAVCRLRSRLLQDSISHVAKFVAPSEFLAEYFSQSSLIPSDRFCVIPNGVGRPPEQISASSGGDSVNVVYLGQLVNHKGINTLLDAAKLLANQDVRISIAGSGPLETAIQQSEHVEFIGTVRGEEKRRAFLDADVLVVPSEWYENNPLVVLEALQYGLAIVASSIGGIPELVEDRVNGRLVVPGSSESLAEALSDLCRDREALSRFQLESRRRSEAYTKERMIESYLELYREFVRSEPASIGRDS